MQLLVMKGCIFFAPYILFAFTRAKVLHPPVTASTDESLHGNFSEISTLFRGSICENFAVPSLAFDGGITFCGTR